jgi:hypothetical protein
LILSLSLAYAGGDDSTVVRMTVCSFEGVSGSLLGGADANCGANCGSDAASMLSIVLVVPVVVASLPVGKALGF